MFFDGSYDSDLEQNKEKLDSVAQLLNRTMLFVFHYPSRHALW